MLYSTIFLFFDVPQYSDRFDYIKDRRRAFYFNNQKIIAYHLYQIFLHLLLYFGIVPKVILSIMSYNAKLALAGV